MCSGSEAGSYLRLIDFVYLSTLDLRVIKKKKKLTFDESVVFRRGAGTCTTRRSACAPTRASTSRYPPVNPLHFVCLTLKLSSLSISRFTIKSVLAYIYIYIYYFIYMHVYIYIYIKIKRFRGVWQVLSIASAMTREAVRWDDLTRSLVSFARHSTTCLVFYPALYQPLYNKISSLIYIYIYIYMCVCVYIHIYICFTLKPFLGVWQVLSIASAMTREAVRWDDLTRSLASSARHSTTFRVCYTKAQLTLYQPLDNKLSSHIYIYIYTLHSRLFSAAGRWCQ